VGSRISVAFVLILTAASSVAAQPMVFTGIVTGHLGASAHGDVQDWALTPGVSMAVIDESGLGVEIDASYAGDFDSAQFADSSIGTVMLNFTAIYPHERLRPFMTAGAGLMRVSATSVQGTNRVSDTDAGWSLGGGLLYMVNEALGFRGDARYFRQFGRQDDLPLGSNSALSFVRYSFGVTYSWPLDR
jgi:opacity protein-like surface antigen